MAKQRSAGVLMYRRRTAGIELFLVHPGGPFWAKKDDGAWSIPKGLFTQEEDPIAAAKREFEEETGVTLVGDLKLIGDFKQPSGKVITAFAIEGDCDAGIIKSNLFSMEWPPRSGTTAEFPEIDRADWFSTGLAGTKILKGQRAIIEKLCEILGTGLSSHPEEVQDSLFA